MLKLSLIFTVKKICSQGFSSSGWVEEFRIIWGDKVQILFSSKFYGNLLIKKKSHGKFFLQKTLAEHYTLNKEKCFTETNLTHTLWFYTKSN
jgi:hypothetical protein